MRTFKKLLPLLAGIAVFLVCNQILNYLLIPYQFTRMKIHRIETESWQDLILGSSHGCSALDPAVLTEKTGRSCFNAAAGGQYPADNYYLLLDACRHHKPERVIFEYDPAYWIAGDPFNRNARYQLDVMAPSVVRARYFFDQFFNSDLRQVLMPWLAYRRDHLRIRQTLAVKQSEAYRTFSSEPFSTEYQTCRADGFTAISDQAPRSETIPELAFTTANERYVRENDAAFLRLVDTCMKEGIALVVVQTPMPPSTVDAWRPFFEEGHAHMEALASQYGFMFLDYVQTAGEGDGTAEAVNWADEDFSDGEGHMRGSSAARFSQIFGERLLR